jgi:zinc D-Ala-D-Ala carboxypeptidase
MLVHTYKTFSRRDWVWPHFTPRELACRCRGRGCEGEYWHDPDFLTGLEALRAALGRALVINSGHRCAIWNTVVGGASRSAHRRIAADIALKGHDRHAFLAAARAAGFTGIGRGRTYIHLDRRRQPAEWTYPGAEDAWRI